MSVIQIRWNENRKSPIEKKKSIYKKLYVIFNNIYNGDMSDRIHRYLDGIIGCLNIYIWGNNLFADKYIRNPKIGKVNIIPNDNR